MLKVLKKLLKVYLTIKDSLALEYWMKHRNILIIKKTHNTKSKLDINYFICNNYSEKIPFTIFTIADGALASS